METIDITAAERRGFERVLNLLPPGTCFAIEARRFIATLGPITEVVELRGPVHAKYDRQGGRWVESFARDVRAGLFETQA